MTKVLLDTDVIVDFLRNGIDKSDIFRDIKDKKAQAFVSVITAFELYNGALLSPNPKQKLEDLSIILGSMEIMPFDNTQSYVASKIYAYLVKNGAKLEMRDILIASCAITKNIKILTNNKKHFNRIPELQFF